MSNDDPVEPNHQTDSARHVGPGQTDQATGRHWRGAAVGSGSSVKRGAPMARAPMLARIIPGVQLEGVYPLGPDSFPKATVFTSPTTRPIKMAHSSLSS